MFLCPERCPDCCGNLAEICVSFKLPHIREVQMLKFLGIRQSQQAQGIKVLSPKGNCKIVFLRYLIKA